MQFLTPQSIWLEKSHLFPNKNAILHFFADKLSKIIQHPPEELFEALLAREALQTTAQKKGTAIPHCTIDKIQGVYAGFLKLDNPVIFDEKTNQECDLFFCIISAQNAGAEYLKFLAKVARFIRDNSNQETLRYAKKTTEIEKNLMPLFQIG